MDKDIGFLWFLGKLHEVFSYGLISAVVCLCFGLVDFPSLASCAFAPVGIPNYFGFYMFWTLVGFLPISVVCAFATKYADNGDGLLFHSDSIVIIMFGHLFEDILGLFGTPFWFLKDLFSHSLGGWKTADYAFYLVLILFDVSGIALTTLISFG